MCHDIVSYECIPVVAWHLGVLAHQVESDTDGALYALQYVCKATFRFWLAVIIDVHVLSVTMGLMHESNESCAENSALEGGT